VGIENIRFSCGGKEWGAVCISLNAPDLDAWGVWSDCKQPVREVSKTKESIADVVERMIYGTIAHHLSKVVSQG